MIVQAMSKDSRVVLEPVFLFLEEFYLALWRYWLVGSENMIWAGKQHSCLPYSIQRMCSYNDSCDVW